MKNWEITPGPNQQWSQDVSKSMLKALGPHKTDIYGDRILGIGPIKREGPITIGEVITYGNIRYGNIRNICMNQ